MNVYEVYMNVYEVYIHAHSPISPSLRSQSWDIARYPEIANQSNCTILGGSRVAYTNNLYQVHMNIQYIKYI